MVDYNKKTKEELLEVIRQLEERLNTQSVSESSCSYSIPGRFREEYYRDILDTFPDMITVSDYDANFIELVSAPHTNHVEGVSNEELLHSNLKDVVPAEAYHRIRANMDEVIRTGETHTARHSLMFHGKMRHYENRVCPLGDKYLLCMCRDVTELVETETALIDAVPKRRKLTV